MSEEEGMQKPYNIVEDEYIAEDRQEQPEIPRRHIPFDVHNMPRVECFYHKGQFISNICKAPECVIPCCPLCIHIHSNEHLQQGTQPIFESLEVLLNDVQFSVGGEINKFTNSFYEIKNHVSTFEVHANHTIRKLKEIKHRVIEAVEQFFSGLENEINHKQQKNVVNQERDANHLLKMIKERLDSMHGFLEQLSTTNCLKSVIPFYTTTFHDDNQQYYRKIHEYINNFPTVSSEVIFHHSRIAEINLFLNSILRVEHTSIPDYLGIHQLPPTDVHESQLVRSPQSLIRSQKRSSIPDARLHYSQKSSRNHVEPYVQGSQPHLGYPVVPPPMNVAAVPPHHASQYMPMPIAHPQYHFRPPYHRF